jgi:murein DD-endopeptidase MepM/ murein hydrolase activator NlpD
MARHHTVIFVPHARAKLRKWRVTSFQIGFATFALLAVTAAAALVTGLHFRADLNPVELARLKRENERLRQANLSFEGSLRQLQERMSGYEDRTRRLAIVAGIDNLGEPSEAGVGGGMPLAEAASYEVASLSRMNERAGELAGRLDAVETKLGERVRWISSTPSIAPVKGLLTSGFGYRNDPMTHGPGIHQGVDIAAAPGQPVHASAEGIVVRAGEVNGLGLAVYVAHAYGLSTRYGHLSRVEVRPGQRVHRGDVVGRVGSTGRSTGYHLHYEVRIDGAAVNPLGYILDDAS